MISRPDVQRAEAIQGEYYLRTINPSDLSTRATLAAEIAHYETAFAAAIRSAEVKSPLLRQMAFARHAPIRGSPSLASRDSDGLPAIRVDSRDFTVTISGFSARLAPQAHRSIPGRAEL